MTRIYISDQGSDRNDGLTKGTPIYSWKRVRKLFSGHIEICVDSAATRKRLMRELGRVPINRQPNVGVSPDQIPH
jgi:hypothetical protein